MEFDKNMADAIDAEFDALVGEAYNEIMVNAKDHLLAPVAVAQRTALRLARDPRFAPREGGDSIWGGDPVYAALHFALRALPKDGERQSLSNKGKNEGRCRSFVTSCKYH